MMPGQPEIRVIGTEFLPRVCALEEAGYPADEAASPEVRTPLFFSDVLCSPLKKCLKSVNVILCNIFILSLSS